MKNIIVIKIIFLLIFLTSCQTIKQKTDDIVEKDEQLIGGATIRVGDHMIDGSVRSQLSNLNRFLIN